MRRSGTGVDDTIYRATRKLIGRNPYTFDLELGYPVSSEVVLDGFDRVLDSEDYVARLRVWRRETTWECTLIYMSKADLVQCSAGSSPLVVYNLLRERFLEAARELNLVPTPESQNRLLQRMAVNIVALVKSV